MKTMGFGVPHLAPAKGEPGPGGHVNVKPRLRTRHLSTAGRSAFASGPAAFGTDAQAAGPAAAFSGGPGAPTGAGDMGE